MDQKFIEKAKAELGENYLKKSQSLEQFREWLSKHPFLNNARQDDSYLLQFLRVRKFRMDDAFQTYERMLLSRKRYGQFFDDDFSKVSKMYETGCCYPLPGRDKDGRKFILVQPRKWDPEVYSPEDSIRLFSYVVTILLEEEETQIGGIALIFDYSQTTLKHLLSPADLLDFMDFVKKCTTSRQKGNYIINLPTFGSFVVNVIKSTLSEKLKNRLVVLGSPDELKNHIDPSLLPKHYGGTGDEAEMMKDFAKLEAEKREEWQKLLDYKLDWSKVPHEKLYAKVDDEAVGSFRKLEID